MKKICLLSLAAFGLLFASCEETIEPAKPQTNPQQPIMTDGNIVTKATGVLASEETLKLDNYLTEYIPLVQLEEATNLPEGAVVNYTMEISDTEKFANYRTLSLETKLGEDNGIYYSDAYSWQAAQIELFGETIEPVETYYRVLTFVTLNNTNYRYNALDYYAVSGKIDVQRMKPEYVIEPAYYIFGAFIGNDSPATAVQMSHEDGDVYGNPVFTYLCQITEAQAAAGFDFMIAPESQHNANGTIANCYGLPSDEDGNVIEDATTLVLGGAPVTLNEVGKYEISFNAYTLEYSIVNKDRMYVPGGANGWSFGNNVLSTTDGHIFSGYVGLSGAFKVTDADNWNSNNYGAGATEGTLDATGGDISIAEPGLYYMTVNMNDLTYTVVPITTIGIIGSFSANNWGSDYATMTMGTIANEDGTESTDYWTWTADVDFTDATTQWKFRMNEGWTYNLGASGDVEPVEVKIGSTYEGLVGGGKNLATPMGNTVVTLDLSVAPYSCSVKEK